MRASIVRICGRGHRAGERDKRTDDDRYCRRGFRTRNTWWTIYTFWNPGIQRYPGCFLAPIVQNAEAGDETSIAHLIENGVYADIQELLRMQSNSGAVFSSSVPMHTLPTTAVDRARIATRNVRPG